MQEDKDRTARLVLAKDEPVYCFDGMLDNNSAGLLKRWIAGCAASRANSPLLIMTSCGGSLEQAFSIFDMVRSLLPGLRICVLGECKSAATLVLLAARPENRLSGPRVRFMVHCAAIVTSDGMRLSAELPVDPGEVKRCCDENDLALSEGFELHERTRQLIEVVARETHLDPDTSEKLHSLSQHFSAEQAREMGFVGAILEEA